MSLFAEPLGVIETPLSAYETNVLTVELKRQLPKGTCEQGMNECQVSVSCFLEFWLLTTCTITRLHDTQSVITKTTRTVIIVII